MGEIKKHLAQLSKNEACDMCVKELSNTCNRINPIELDMSITEFAIRNAFANGVLWKEAKAEEKEKEQEKKHIDSGVWLAITEFAFYNESHQLIEDVIKAMGFCYEDCISLMEQSGCNNDVLEPIINKTFGIDTDDDEAEESPTEFDEENPALDALEAEIDELIYGSKDDFCF